MFAIGVAIFTARLRRGRARPSVEVLNVARAVQGLGGAIVMPLTLTILSASVPPERRGLALGAWGAIGGLAIAFGPVVGGAVVEGSSWQRSSGSTSRSASWLVPLALVAAEGVALALTAASTCRASAWSAPGRSESSSWEPNRAGRARRSSTALEPRCGARRSVRRLGAAARRARCCPRSPPAIGPSRSANDSSPASRSSARSARSFCSRSSFRLGR